MIVLGGGPIGCELGQALDRLGVKIDIVQRSSELLPREDRDVARNILMPFQFLRQKVDWSVVPWCTYTDPEVAHVGLGEKDAQKKNIDYDLFVVPLEEVDRAVVESEDAGFAMKAKIGLGTIASTIHAYPTFAELARKAGDKYNKTRLTPTAKKFFTWLYERARK